MNHYTSLDHLDSRSQNYLAVQWIYTNRCNFDCHYCDPEVNDGSTPDLSLETVLPFCRRLIEHGEKIGKKVYIELTGGEVTFLPHFGELISAIAEAGGHIGINSNGTPGLTWWKTYAPQLDSLMLSYHFSHSKLSHFQELIPYLTSLDHLKLHISIMMDPKYFDECFEVAETIKPLTSGSLTLQRLLTELSGSQQNFRYTPEQLEKMTYFNTHFGIKQWLQKLKEKLGAKKPMPRGGLVLTNSMGKKEKVTSSDIINKSLNSFQGWSCSAGVENLVIDRFGDIYRGWCLEGGKLGHISDKNFDFNLNEIICQKKICACGFDILCKKTRPQIG